ncbi:hypothetical protein IJ472_01355 [bacterium]|nr:hypothetical protein [bacterium]
MKKLWTAKDVEVYLKSLKPGQKVLLPDDVYCTENFTWNEVLMTKNRSINIPTKDILENLQHSANNLQKYRNKMDVPFYITSSWRTPQEQQKLINDYKIGKLKNKPSDTSLHLEGLALDFVVPPDSRQVVQKMLDKNHMGELEFGTDYTHVALPTFSKSYLERNGIYNDKIYKQLHSSNLSDIESQKIIKRMNPINWQPLPSNFDKQSNYEMFSEDMSLNKSQIIDVNQLAKQYGLKSFGMEIPKPVEQKSSQYSGYKNPLTGNDRIYTKEDVEAMSKEEFAESENEIMAQVKSMRGTMPSNGDLNREVVFGGDVVFINSYVRSDGTEVKGYYRSKPRY